MDRRILHAWPLPADSERRMNAKAYREIIPGMIVLHDPANLDAYEAAVVAFGEGRIRRQELMTRLFAFGISAEVGKSA